MWCRVTFYVYGICVTIMTYLQLAYLHLASIVPAMLLGTSLIVLRKGTPQHRLAGRAYMVLMLATAVTTLWMPAQVGPQLIGHFGFVHVLSFVTVAAVIGAWRAIQRRDVTTHRKIMIRLYIGAFVIAGGFTLMPGRMIHDWLFG